MSGFFPTWPESSATSASSWFNRESGLPPIHWQEGYGAFTVSFSQRAAVHRYIERQQEHHREQTFAAEYEEFLIKNEVEYDPRFFLD